ncbi:hypothetical protein BX600DRAFT_444318 [Xylariales sp. PMI_506]|nr:hypothetical protein BX600DRAFT_444318 [Xylariales sp. PMI_506]
MPSKATETFHVPELLVIILHEVDIRTLLVSAQRVNHQWRATVTRTKSLQQALYLECAPDGGKRRPNPLLVDALGPWFDDGEITNLTNSHNMYSRNAFIKLPLFEIKHQLAFKDVNASWRRMLITQPPVRKLGCYMVQLESGCLPDPHDFQSKMVEYLRGLRMGRLYDQSFNWLASDPSAQFRIIWDVMFKHSKPDIFRLKVRRSEVEGVRVAFAQADMVLMGERWNNQKTKPDSKT